MANFTRDVFQSTQEKDQNLERKKQEALERRAEGLQRQFGVKQSYGTPRIGVGSIQGAEETRAQVSADEAERRKKAAQNAYTLGSSVDTRRSKMSDDINAAINKRQRLVNQYATTQDQQNRSTALADKQTAVGAQQKIEEMNFNKYKNQSDRNEAMREAYAKGSLDREMFDMSVKGALKQQDIDNYFAMIEAQLNAAYKDAIQGDEWAWREYQTQLDKSARNTAAILSGAAGTAQAGVNAYYSRSPKYSSTSYTSEDPYKEYDYANYDSPTYSGYGSEP